MKHTATITIEVDIDADNVEFSVSDGENPATNLASLILGDFKRQIMEIEAKNDDQN